MWIGLIGFIAIMVGLYLGNHSLVIGGFATMLLQVVEFFNTMNSNLIILTNNMVSFYTMVRKKLTEIKAEIK